MERKILIVDDILSNRLILKEMLKKDYDIIEAANGEEALDVLRRIYTSISAVLLDISMPGIDGFEVLRRIRTDAGFSHMPVIMITGSEDEASRVKSLALGANDYVMKPYSSEIIKHCLKNNIALREAAATVNILEKDRLTGIWNREAFFRRAAVEVKQQPAGYFVLACVDVEGFKIINDQYGGDTGDGILKSIAEALQHSCDENGGLCGRIFADRFVGLYPLALLKEVEIGPEVIKARVLKNMGIDITLSVGRYIIEDMSLSIESMFDRASIAKSTVKGRYDTHVAVYDDSMRDHIVHEQKIVNEMNAALAGNQFEVWFQPQYNHTTNAMIGAEALVRWRDVDGTLIPPDEFIPIFERNGFIYDLDKFVWEEVCKCLRRWLDEGRSPLAVSVNISRYDLLRPDMIEVITGLIKKYDLPRDLLRLEVTETAFSQSFQQIVEVVSELVNAGFTVEIDDFGSGYSSLNTLKDVPAQIIKLDMKFLQSSADSQRGGNIVESVVRMAKWLDMSVIAEGVETVEQADYLRSIGCSYMQGYLYAKPMPVDAYEAHCKGSGKEERLLALETVNNLDNNSFWDPKSMDTLIFNSYVGAACIFEYRNSRIELLRATEKYLQVIGGAGMTMEKALKLKWSEHLDTENRSRVIHDIEKSMATRKEITGEYVFLDLPNCPHETCLRSTLRVIASIGDRCLVYCTNENITAQRKAEQEKRAAAAQIQGMMDDMPGGFVRMSLEVDGSIKPVYINKGFTKLIHTGHDKTMEIYAKDALAGVHPDDLHVVKDVIAKMFENGEAHSSRYRLMRGDGKYVWLTVFGRVTEDTAGNTFLNIYYTDASEQVKEEETQKSLLDNLPGGAGIYEFKNGQMSLTYQNKRYWDLVGLKKEAFLDAAPMSAVHPDDLAVIMQELTLAIEQHRDMACDIRLHHLEKGYFPVHLVGRIVRKEADEFLIYATFTPINVQGVSYQQMLPVVMSAIMKSTSDLSFAKDTNFRYFTCSRAFAHLVGRKSEEEVIGKTDYELFNKEMADKFRQDDEALLAAGKALIDMVEAIPSEDGSPHYSSTSKYLLYDGAGEVIGLYGVGRDITKAVVQDSQLRLINDSIPGGIATYFLKDDMLKITYCNDGFCQLFGGTRTGFERRGDFDPLDWVYEDDRKGLLTRIDDLVRHNVPMDYVFRTHLNSDGYKWINIKAAAAEHRGDAVQFSAVLLDVTERQNTMEQLRISEDENNLAASIGGNIIMRYNIAEKSLSLTKEIAAAYSLPKTIENVPEEPVRRGLIAAESVEAYMGFFEAILNGAKAASVLYQEQYSGEWRWVEGKSTTIFTDDGEPVKAIISLYDVTERLEKESIYKKWQQSLDDRRPASYTLFRCNLNRNASYDTREGTLLIFDFDDAGLTFNERATAYVEHCVYEEDKDGYLAFTNSDSLLAGYYRGRRSATLDYRERLKDDSYRWLRLSVDLVESLDSTEVEAYLMYEDIDEVKKAELETKELSETDPLTGILNRKTFAAKVNERLLVATAKESYAFLMLDIDSFKQVNDVFGHGAGDQVLVDVANSLRSIMRHNDLLGRLGGDEFVLFLDNVFNTRAIAAKAQQICALVRKAYSLEVQISGSVGIAVAPHDGMDFDTLYKKADSALYHVKGSGKDSYAYYNEDMAEEHLIPEADIVLTDGRRKPEKKRRMLIVDDNMIDHAMLQNIFHEEYIVEKAKDGMTALTRLGHYGSAISVVLLDLMMPGMDGFDVLEKMQDSAELRTIPVIIVSGDESRETCLKAIRRGATDFITKPVDIPLLRIRVQSAVSKSENERLRAKNSLLEVENEERVRYESALNGAGITFIEFNWLTGEFSYYPSISNYLLGRYDDRALWQILLADMVTDTDTVREMQQLVHTIAENAASAGASKIVRLKTPDKTIHRFRMVVRKLRNEHQHTSKIIIALDDLEYEV